MSVQQLHTMYTSSGGGGGGRRRCSAAGPKPIAVCLPPAICPSAERFVREGESRVVTLGRSRLQYRKRHASKQQARMCL